MVAWILGGLGGCVVEEPEQEHGEEPMRSGAQRLGSVARGPEQTSQGCDGTPLPSCDGPFTGAACDLPCSLGPPDLEALECDVDRYCHSDGSTYGLAARNAVLYPASPDEPDEAVQANLEAWIVEHPADLGLEAGLTADDLDLHRMNDFRSSAGALTIFRFGQTYRGIPVLAPDGIVTLVHGPQGAISITGAIIDRRTSCDGTDWLYASCDDLPEYSGGALTCDQNTCALDYAQCTTPGLDTTEGTVDPDDSAISMAPPAETETTGAAGVDPSACDCRAAASGRWLVLFPLFVLGVRRRRRRA
ncbi:hypothetical protein [Paraliomyxa miuraensis]|uniref:hypothetical protein n=1 Tax=Paraliomyxa miuraensis TaxID=376150 RepID=UPI00225B4000|nr:hypothetical protein [Paraliomyxa miuraensis]MCX4239442.1 hypothetical protein [Paraliomyxa miuraensis]